MPDTKTPKKSWDKIWERIPQPNAAAQNSGGQRSKLLSKIVISTLSKI